MEYHAENAGTPYEVLLGLLGRDVRVFDFGLGLCADVVGPLRKTAQAYSAAFSCASPLPQQSFVPGSGRWLLHRASTDRVYLFYEDHHLDDIARIS